MAFRCQRCPRSIINVSRGRPWEIASIHGKTLAQPDYAAYTWLSNKWRDYARLLCEGCEHEVSSEIVLFSVSACVKTPRRISAMSMAESSRQRQRDFLSKAMERAAQRAHDLA